MSGLGVDDTLTHLCGYAHRLLVLSPQLRPSLMRGRQRRARTGSKLVPDEDVGGVEEGADFNVILQEKTLTYYWVVVRSIFRVRIPFSGIQEHPSGVAPLWVYWGGEEVYCNEPKRAPYQGIPLMGTLQLENETPI